MGEGLPGLKYGHMPSTVGLLIAEFARGIILRRSDRFLTSVRKSPVAVSQKEKNTHKNRMIEDSVRQGTQVLNMRLIGENKARELSITIWKMYKLPQCKLEYPSSELHTRGVDYES